MKLIISKRKKRGYRVDFTNGWETITVKVDSHEHAVDFAEDMQRVAECEISDLTGEAAP